MMKQFKLVIEYDGSAFCGWQRQKNDPTIQGVIEAALERMTCQPIVVTGSGRTDAGVHAFGQVATFRCHTRITAEAFQGGLNSLLAPDIVIHQCNEVDAAFHPRFDATGKIYHYRILNRYFPAAIGRQYAWHIRRPLKLSAMRLALSHVVGTHDFKSFEGSGSPREHTVRQIRRAELVEEGGGRLTIQIEGNGFLRFMVRNIVGTLVEVGLEKISPDDFLRIRDACDRTQAGATAPAHGLFLMRVMYGE